MSSMSVPVRLHGFIEKGGELHFLHYFIPQFSGKGRHRLTSDAYYDYWKGQALKTENFANFSVFQDEHSKLFYIAESKHRLSALPLSVIPDKTQVLLDMELCLLLFHASMQKAAVKRVLKSLQKPFPEKHEFSFGGTKHEEEQ